VHAGHVTLTFLCDEFASRPSYFFAGSPQVPCKFFPPTSRRDAIPKLNFILGKTGSNGGKNNGVCTAAEKNGKRYGRLALLGEDPRLTKMTNASAVAQSDSAASIILQKFGENIRRGHLTRGGKTISRVLYSSGSHFRGITIFTGRAFVSIIGIIPTTCILNASNRTSLLDYRFIYFEPNLTEARALSCSALQQNIYFIHDFKAIKSAALQTFRVSSSCVCVAYAERIARFQWKRIGLIKSVSPIGQIIRRLSKYQ